MRNLMVDLETLDTIPSAIILSIGAVEFSKDEVKPLYYQTVDLDSQHDRTWSASTLLWWLKQSKEAQQAAFFSEDNKTLKVALEMLSTIIDSSTLVWGNGPTFDNSILIHAYNQVDIKLPWAYKNDRCFRTYKSFHRKLDIVNTGAHNALDDALYQAKQMQIWLQEDENGRTIVS